MRRSVLVMCLLVLSGCRLDVNVAVEMEPDGTGVVTVTAVAAAELVAQVPDLVEDLRLDDAVANGWVVDGPTDTDDGGLALTLTHTFTSDEELANVLNSIGPPLTRMEAARTTGDDEQTTNAINGVLQLENGFETFADAELVQAAGGLPFAEEFAATGVTPPEAMSFTYRVSLPGELVSAAGTEVDDDVIEWQAPLDGSQASLYVETVQRPPGTGGAWAAPLSGAAFIALVLWVVVAGVFIVFVAVARGAKRRRRERSLRRLHQPSR